MVQNNGAEGLGLSDGADKKGLAIPQPAILQLGLCQLFQSFAKASVTEANVHFLSLGSNTVWERSSPSCLSS